MGHDHPVIGKRQATRDQERTCALPRAPDFSQATHARLRAQFAQIVAMAKAGAIAALLAVESSPVSSSPKLSIGTQHCRLFVMQF